MRTKMEHILSDKSFEKICVSVKKHKPQIEKLAVHCLATGGKSVRKEISERKTGTGDQGNGNEKAVYSENFVGLFHGAF